MATYLQGVTDNIKPQKLYTPNYEFLGAALGEKQSQYDRGLNHIKSLYDQLLNTPLTNSENQEYRDMAFKKLKTSLRSVSSMDLSKSSNIVKATSLIKPISEDADIIYDMYATKKNQEAAQLMESYRNSTDMDKRAMYNDANAVLLNYAQDDLRHAKRGDGSIQQIAPGEFVPFEDVNEFLNKRADDLELEIKYDTLENGYIVTHKNGKEVVGTFQTWAAQQMGDRFDRQFLISAKAETESQVRNTMKQNNISRNEALTSFTQEKTPTVKAGLTDEQKGLSHSLDLINFKIKKMEESYGKTGYPSNRPDLQEDYTELLQQKQYHEDALKNKTKELSTVEEDNSYIATNMYGIYANAHKKNAALDWGEIRAMSTQELSLKSDATWISNQNRALKLKIHQEDRLDREYWKKKEFNLKSMEYLAKLNGGYFDKNNNGKNTSSSSSSSDGSELNESYLGTYISANTKKAVDIMGSALNINMSKMYNGVTNSENGLMKLIVDEKDYNKTVAVISKVKSYAEGNEVSFTAEDKSILNNYFRKIGYVKTSDAIYNDKDAASLGINMLASGTYETAVKTLETYRTQGTISDHVKNIDSFTQVITALKDTDEKLNLIESSYKEINKELYDSSGKLKDMYEGAKIIGYSDNNVPLYDLSKVSDDGKKLLATLVDKQFRQMTAPVGSSYEFQNISPGELRTALNDTKAIIRDDSGDLVDNAEEIMNNISKISTDNLKKIFGDSMQVDFDPVLETSYLTLKVSPKETAIAKALGVKSGGVYKIELPYSTISANKMSLDRMYKYMMANTAGSDFVSKDFKIFKTNKNAIVESPKAMDETGFSYSVAGTTNASGQYGLNVSFEFLNPTTHLTERNVSFVPILNRNSSTEFNQVYHNINKTHNEYLAGLGKFKEESIKQGTEKLKN